MFLFLLKTFLNLPYLKGRVSERGIFHWLVHSLMTTENKGLELHLDLCGWQGLKCLEKILLLLRHNSKELHQKWSRHDSR